MPNMKVQVTLVSPLKLPQVYNFHYNVYFGTWDCTKDIFTRQPRNEREYKRIEKFNFQHKLLWKKQLKNTST